MGVYTGLYPDRVLSKVFQTVSLIGISLPTFLIGILLILFFGVTLRWLPISGRGTPLHYLMPAFCLSLWPVAAEVASATA